MLQIPLSLGDIRTMITLVTVVLFVTNEFVSSYSGDVNLIVNEKRLKNVTNIMILIFAIMFLVSLYLEITT